MYGPSPFTQQPIPPAAARHEPTSTSAAESLIRAVALWDRHGREAPRLRSTWCATVQSAPAFGTGLHPPATWHQPVVTPAVDDSASVFPTLSVPVPGLVPGTESVLSLTFERAAAQPTALEVWRHDLRQPGMLTMHDGWYSDAARPLALQTLHTRLPYGIGLPGLAWELSSPAYFSHIGTSQVFVRADAALQSGLHHGLAVPVAPDTTVIAVLTGARRPIARRIELALGDGRELRCVAGHCQRQGDLFAQQLDPPWGAPLLGGLIGRRGPVLVHRCDVPNHADWFEALDAEVLLAWPFNEGASPMCMALWL